MDQRVKRSRHDYTADFKLWVVERVERGELTYRQAQRHYGIQGAATVLRWLRQYGRSDWSKASSDLKVQGMPMTKKSVCCLLLEAPLPPAYACVAGTF